MKKLSLFFIVLISTSSFCQETNPLTPEQVNSLNNKHSISLDLLPFIARDGSRARLGYIYSFNEKVRAGLHFGLGNSSMLPYINDVKNYELYEVRPQVYYRINQWSERLFAYLGLELVYINHKQRLFNDFYENVNNRNVFYKQTDFQRIKYGALTHFGLFIPIDKTKLVFNPHIGVGVRTKENTFANTILNEPSADERDAFLLYNELFYYEGVRNGFVITLGAKIQYSF